MTVELHIETLVLEGLGIAHGQRRVLKAALESELARLISSGPRSQPADIRAQPEIAAPGIRPAALHDPGSLGRQIAGSVYRGITR